MWVTDNIRHGINDFLQTALRNCKNQINDNTHRTYFNKMK